MWNGTQWVNPTITGGTETEANYVQLSDGSIMMNAAASGGETAFRSADGGLTYTQQGSMSAAWAMPGATPPGLAPIPGNYNLNGTPNLQPLGSGAIYQIVRAPGGELFASGEAEHSHSLDDGKTWLACYDAVTLPLRNNPGVIYTGIDDTGVGGKPVFPNPHVYFFPGHAGGSGSTRTGEEALALENLPGGGLYLAAGFVDANSAGAALSGQFTGGFGDTCSTSGETLAYGFSDRHVYSWDGTQWTQTAQLFNSVPGSKSVSGDGYNAYFCVSGTLWKYTPNPAAILPPHVQEGTPQTISLNTQNWVDLTGVIAIKDMGSQVAVGTPTYQWIGRGAGPVVFDAPQSMNPKAYFSVPGDYLLNMQVTHPNNALFGGSNVIVHVTAKTGGIAPTIITQPINAALVPNAQFNVTATGTALKYQWRRNGTDLRDVAGVISGAQTSMLTLLNPTKNDESGIFHCLVYSDYGRTESYACQLGFPPTVNVSDQSIPAGQTTTILTAIGNGTGPLTVEWKDGSNTIVGTNPTYAATAGTYTATVTNIFGMATASATVTAGSSMGCTVSMVYTGNNVVNPGYSEPRGTYGTFNYTPGTTVAISAPMFSRDASPNSGFHTFTGWVTTGGTIADSTSPHTALTLPGTATNITVTAQYAATSGVFPLTVVNGTGSRLWQAGDTVSINALDAPPGRQFSSWAGDSLITMAGNVNNPSPSFVMPARAVKITALYTGSVSGTVADPTFSPLAGTFATPQSVTISTVTAGATIYYTLDGSTPTGGSSVCSTALNIASTTTLKAIATKSGSTNSGVVSGTFTITPTPPPTPAGPTLTVDGGKKLLNTTKAKLTLKGQATGTITRVTGQLGKKTLTAKGTRSWKLTAKLKPGKNKLILIAHGPGGDSTPVNVVIVRK